MMPNDFIRLAMEGAANHFGGKDGTFNAAGFSQAIGKLSGVQQTLDGGIVRVLLCGRRDVDLLSPGDAHYRLRVRRA